MKHMHEADYSRIGETLRDTLMEMHMEKGGSAVFSGSQSCEAGQKWYACIVGESPMTPNATARIVQSLLEMAAAALGSMTPQEIQAAAEALRDAADSLMERTICGEGEKP